MKTDFSSPVATAEFCKFRGILSASLSQFVWLCVNDSPSGKGLSCQCRICKRYRFHLWIRKTPWRRAWQPTAVFLPEESYGQRSLVGYSP